MFFRWYFPVEVTGSNPKLYETKMKVILQQVLVQIDLLLLPAWKTEPTAAYPPFSTILI